MHRRDFLDPLHLAQAAGRVVGVAQDLPSDTQVGQEVALVRYARAAMATVFEIVLPFGHRLTTATISDAFALLDELEEQLSVYRESSAVCDLNRRAAHEDVPLEPGLFRHLRQAQELSRATAGAFDVTMGALIKAWGFFRGPKRVPSEAELQQARARCGWQHLVLDSSSNSARYGVEGLEINLGSIGKGYALDCVAQWLRSTAGVSSFLLHGGKSSVLALGTPPGQARGWSVALEHPRNPKKRLVTLDLKDKAMATSAATYKHLEHRGQKLGHLLDPRTGWPARGVASATALAPTAAEADALATAFYVLGPEATRRYCQDHPDIGAVILPEGSAKRPVIINAEVTIASGEDS